MIPVITWNWAGQSYGIRSYPLMLSLAMLSGMLLFPRAFRRLGMSQGKALLISVAMILAALIGARLMYLTLYPQQLKLGIREIFSPSLGNFTLYGGIGAAAGTVWIVLRRTGFPFLKWMDLALVPTGISLFLARTGCLLNGCCYGKATQVSWAIEMRKGGIAYNAYLKNHPLSLFMPMPKIHPTQIYELVVIAAAFAGARMAAGCRKEKLPAGVQAITFGVILTLGRWIVFCFRDFPRADRLSDFLRAPLTYSIVLMLLAGLLYRMFGGKGNRAV